MSIENQQHANNNDKDEDVIFHIVVFVKSITSEMRAVVIGLCVFAATLAVIKTVVQYSPIDSKIRHYNRLYG